MVNSTKVKHRFCVECDADITHLAKNSQRCKLCAAWRIIAYQKWYHSIYQKKKRELGTTDFSEHRKTNFEEELADIEDEMIRIGIKLK